MLPFLHTTVVMCAVAAITDIRTGRIPNWLSFSGIAFGLVGHVAEGWYTEGWQAALREGLASLAGIALCSMGPLLMYWRGSMGGGDLKLFAAIGAVCQPLLGIECQTYSLVVAALIAPARLAYEGRLIRVFASAARRLINPLLPVAYRRTQLAPTSTWLRLGPAILTGSLAVLLLHSDTFPFVMKVLLP